MNVDEDTKKKIAWDSWDLSKYTTEQLNKELERRGYRNGVLIEPNREIHYKHATQRLDDGSYYCSDCEEHFIDTFDVEIA